VNRKTALQFVERHGIVLESAHGPVVTFTDAAVGERIRGNWWSHPKSHQIFALTRLVRNSPDVLVCRLVDGKITYVHRRVWPALVLLAGRFLQGETPVEEDMELRSAIVLEHRRRYGYRRVSAELRRRGMLANHKRVARIMREDNQLAVQPRQFVVTTDSTHELEVYLNLAYRMKLTGIDQLWVADITYIRLRVEFVYLAVILDGFSRKVVGWALERTLTSRLAIAALREAIAKRQPRPGLIHHSDRGVQYASGDYVAILEQHQMIPSMSRPANPYDNASCESFMKTLKREEIYANAYENLEHLREPPSGPTTGTSSWGEPLR